MLKELVDRRDIVVISKVRTFSSVSSYKKYITPVQTGIPVLDQEIRSTKANNFQNLAYLQIADLYFKDALVIIKTHPKLFLQKFVRNYREWYFRPFADVWPSNDNNRNHGNRIRFMIDSYYLALLGLLIRNCFLRLFGSDVSSIPSGRFLY